MGYVVAHEDIKTQLAMKGAIVESAFGPDSETAKKAMAFILAAEHGDEIAQFELGWLLFENERRREVVRKSLQAWV